MLRLQAAIAATLLLAAPVFAADFKNPACPTITEVEALLTEQGATFVELDALHLLNVAVDAKVLMAAFKGYVVFGYVDSNGCLTGPVPIAQIPPTAGA